MDAGDENNGSTQPLTYGLFPMDQPIQTRLLEGCRALLARATPAQVRDLAALTPRQNLP